MQPVVVQNEQRAKGAIMEIPASVKKIAKEIVDLQQAVAGKHPGFRTAHAKGIVCTGTFVASPEARRITKAAHLQGQPVPVTLRFSNASGSPAEHDGAPDVRGLAVKFSLPDGKKTDLLAISNEAFLAATAEGMRDFLQVQAPDPSTGKADPQGVPRFLESHPAAAAFIGRLMQKPVPASYAQCAYHAVHAFRFVSADGKSQFGRYHWIPEAGEAYLNPEAAQTRDANFLQAELKSRVAKGPASLRLELQLAEAGDATNDATVLWSAGHRVVELGRLAIEAVSPTSAADERQLIFDPLKVTDGIEVSDDPIPAARSAAYTFSYEWRTKES
jgi:catalase